MVLSLMAACHKCTCMDTEIVFGSLVARGSSPVLFGSLVARGSSPVLFGSLVGRGSSPVLHHFQYCIAIEAVRT